MLRVRDTDQVLRHYTAFRFKSADLLPTLIGQGIFKSGLAHRAAVKRRGHPVAVKVNPPAADERSPVKCLGCNEIAGRVVKLQAPGGDARQLESDSAHNLGNQRHLAFARFCGSGTSPTSKPGRPQ